jgi:predicted ATPase with chaperone activity
VGEPSESNRARVQDARNIQLTQLSLIVSSKIVANADMRVGEIPQLCRLQEEGDVLTVCLLLTVSKRQRL